MGMYKKIYVITAFTYGTDHPFEPEVIGTFTSPQLAFAAFELFVSEVQPSEAEMEHYHEYRKVREDGTVIYGLEEWDGDAHLVVKLEPTDLCKKK